MRSDRLSHIKQDEQLSRARITVSFGISPIAFQSTDNKLTRSAEQFELTFLCTGA
jgi:hypothetical protein